jgi:hypothetical protein
MNTTNTKELNNEYREARKPVSVATEPLATINVQK